LVTVAVPEGIQSIVAGFEPSLMTLGLGENDLGHIHIERNSPNESAFAALTEKATVVALGPGLGQSADVDRLVADLYRRLPQPMVIDADGLNALARNPKVLEQPGGPRILTPHPGEFGRLASAAGIPGLAQVGQAAQFAARFKCVVVLKGHRSLITDGDHNELNETGNPGMATGGTGDVLTGVIAALMGQGLEPHAAAHLGCHVHGLAGDMAAEELGQVSLIASDLLKYLPRAFQTLIKDKQPRTA
jgi:NAD(P)H-hydrate epimerase